MAATLKAYQFVCIFVTFYALIIQHTDAADGFLFTMPKVLRYGDMSEFCISVYGPKGGTREVTMSMIDRKDPKIKVLITDTYINGEQQCNNFTVPRPGSYELLLYNATAILHDSVELVVEDRNLVTLVQTDKPIYKPGQKVKFRTLTFKSDQKPRTGLIEAIYIKNPSESRVKQYFNVDSKGIVSLEFQLTNEAEQGKWEILVFLNESISDEPDVVGTFEVKEYVLPRFEVKITLPGFILASDEFIDAKVCASYTYGKPVEGFLDLEMCWSSHMSTPFPCFHQVVEFSGCQNVSVNVTEMQGPTFYPFYGMELKTTASVIENGTGSVVNATQVGPRISTQPLTIELKDYSNGFFKPLIPYYGKAVVQYPDGTPAPGKNISITATDYKNEIKFTRNFTTDESGIVVYSLCGAFDEKTPKLNIGVVAYDYNDDISDGHRGMYTPSKYQDIRQWFSPSLSYINIPKTEGNFKCGDSLTLSVPFTTRPNTNTEFEYQVMARGKIIKSGTVSYKHNITYPGGNLMQPPPEICLQQQNYHSGFNTFPELLEPVPAPAEEDVPPPPPGPDEIEKKESNVDFVIVDNNATEEIGRLIPGILPHLPPHNNGDIEEKVVRAEVLQNTVSNFLLDLPILTIMAPKFTLLIYHTLPSGEVVADSMEYHVEPCFDNDVSMTFNRSSALPGEKVNIHLEAAPGSICGVGIVDKSVNILGGKHQITANTIFTALEQYNTPSWVNSYYSDEKYCEERIKEMMEFREEEGYWHYSSEYVDALQAFMSTGLIALTDLNLQTRPCSRSFPIFYDNGGNGMRALASSSISGEGPIPGPIQITLDGQNKKASASKIRSHFPETWLWDLQIIGVNGSEDIVQTAPHTITSWVGNAVCMDADNGVGVSPMESLTTFQPFFIHLKLPYSAVRGERLPLIISIFNYIEKCLYVQLTLEAGDDLMIHNSRDLRKPQCVCGGGSVSRKLMVTPKDIGSLAITVKAEIVPGVCGKTVDMDLTYIGLTDAVQRKIFVKAEGVLNEYTHTSYICPKGDNENIENLILPLADNVVKDSERGDVKIIGDIMGPALTNLDNLVRMPTGCGEQNMVGFTPNIFVLEYLTSTNRLTEEIQTNAVKFMEIGYQRELKYRHSDGSYSAFGERDDSGSVWLTAFVVKSFAQARPYIFIDGLDLEISLTFLRRSQLETGCFRETGKVFSSYMMGGLGKKKSSYTALTAYVLITLLKADVNATEKVITEGFSCINKEYKKARSKMDTYSLAILAYAHTLYNSESKICKDIMRTLHSKAKKGASSKYWTRDGLKPMKGSASYYNSAPSADVEMTAYALMAHIEYYGSRAVPHTHEIAMWLSQQRNPYGGFSSTQDTVVGLNALSDFALLTYKNDPTNLNVTVKGNGFKGDFQVSEEKNTLLLLQSVRIPTIPNSMSISTKGTGCVLVQANVRFNIPSQDIKPHALGLHLKIQTRHYQHDIDRCDRRTIKLSVGNRGHNKQSKGMSLLTVKMVTSWKPISDSLTKILSMSPQLGIKRYEFDEDMGVVTFYFDELTKRRVDFYLDVEQNRDIAVSSPKPAEVEIFQYYDRDVSILQSYNLKTICGTKAEIPRRVNEIDETLNFPLQVRIGGPARLPGIPRNRRPNSVPVSGTDTESHCPICAQSATGVDNLEEIFCNSTSVFKAITGRGGKKQNSIKLKSNIKASGKLRNLNKFAIVTLPEGCECSLMKPPTKRVYIFASRAMDKKKLFIDSSSAIIKGSKQLVKKFKKMKKNCPRK